MRDIKHIFVTSLVLTILIFSTAMMLNYSLDFFRMGSILETMEEHEIDYESYLTEESFVTAFGGDRCRTMSRRIEILKDEIKEVGTELASYGKISFFRKNDYDYLERKYFLLELKFFTLIDGINKECNSPYIPIIFFYGVDDEISERQGYILSEISKTYKQKVIVISIDKDYDKEPLISALVEKYNITNAPTVIISDKAKYEGIVYEGEINSILRRIIGDADFYGSDRNFDFVLDSAGFDKQDFINRIELALDLAESNFAKGDIYLILGRITKNQSMICRAVDFYEAAKTSSREEKALVHETIAALGCGRDKKEHLLNASNIWAEIGVDFRAEIDFKLANGINPKPLKFDTSQLKIPNLNVQDNISNIKIGEKSIVLTKNDVLVSQTDRVTRDWLGIQINSSPFSDNLLTVFSERLSYSEEELMEDIGWHEGARIKEIRKIGLNHKIASGTIAAKHGDKWYAPDETGVFRFEVPLDKILYPTTRFLSENIAVVIDTHGINMLVEQAVRNKATVVIGCGDHLGKMKAAAYLAEKGIKVIVFPDKYLPLLLGANYSILGSPPIKRQSTVAVLGGQPINFSANSTVVAGSVGDYDSVQSYYDTPARYFRQLSKITDLNVIYVPMNRMNQTNRIIESAEFFNADVIGARIFNSDDYSNVKEWLEKDKNHKAVLFHSMPYPYGYKLLKEFPLQTTFDDISPVFS